MKKLSLIILVTVFAVFFTSCLKPNHSVRVKNQYTTSLKVVIGSNDFGVVGAGSTTSYRSISEGNHTISGDVQGSMGVSGKGKHNWTVSISPVGSVTLAEDK